MANKLKPKHYWIGAVIILVLVLIYIYRNEIADQWNKLTGKTKRIYQDGGFIPPISPITPVVPVNPSPRPLPIFRQVIPIYYPTCPDWTGRFSSNVSFYGASNLFFPNVGGLFVNCPTCIIYNGIRYYFNGSDANGCYYQANWNYIYPTFFNFFSRHHGHHGGPGGPGSMTGGGTGGGGQTGTGGGTGPN